MGKGSVNFGFRGGDWPEPELVAGPDETSRTAPSVAVDEAGDVHLAWCVAPKGGECVSINGRSLPIHYQEV